MDPSSPPPTLIPSVSSASEVSSSRTKRQQQRHCHRLGLLIFTSLYVTFFAGAFFGWGPMQLMLEEDGAFEWKCDDTEELPCPDQSKSLLNLHFVGGLLLVLSPLTGHLADAYGPFVLMVFVASIGCLGLSLIMVSSALQVDPLLYVAFSCISVMASSTAVMMIHTGMAFDDDGDDNTDSVTIEEEAKTRTTVDDTLPIMEPKEVNDDAVPSGSDDNDHKSRRRVISMLNNLYDAGSVSYLILHEIQHATGATLNSIIGGYLGTAVLSFGGSLVFWKLLSESSSTNESIGNLDQKQQDLPENLDRSPTCTNTEATASMNKSAQKCEGSTDKQQQPVTPSCGIRSEAEGNLKDTRIPEVDLKDQESIAPSNYIPIALRLPWEQLRSTQFLLLVSFFSFHICRNMFILTSARSFLAYLGDDEENDKYVTLFTLMMPLSIVGFPFVDCALQRYGYHAGLQLVNALAIIHGTIQVSSTNLNVQIVGFVVFSFYRSFLFSVIFSFLPVFLGPRVLGKANGVMQVCAGITSTINIPLGNLAVTRWDGNFFLPNLFYTVVVIPFVYTAYRMGGGIQQEEESKRSRHSLYMSQRSLSTTVVTRRPSLSDSSPIALSQS